MAETSEIALIDDDEAVLGSTQLLLQRQGIRTLTYSSAEAFLASLPDRHESLACIVSDVRMPGLSGLELQAELQRRGSAIPVVLITGHGDVRMAVAAIKAGAFNFIEKPFVIEDLVAAIRAAAASKAADDETDRQREVVARRAASMTVRQREVMGYVVEGYSSRQIAEKLAISPRTVETYRVQIMEKMGAGSVAMLVRMEQMMSAPRQNRLRHATAPAEPSETDSK